MTLDDITYIQYCCVSLISALSIVFERKQIEKGSISLPTFSFFINFQIMKDDFSFSIQ